ncbi:MAG: hypothetical protein JW829_12275 [Pirellulales bacterium]|nr:hypothetical protein [Pirellulales bacterium]
MFQISRQGGGVSKPETRRKEISARRALFRHRRGGEGKTSFFGGRYNERLKTQGASVQRCSPPV